MNRVVFRGAAAVLAANAATVLSAQSIQQMPRPAQPAASATAPLVAGEARQAALGLASLLEENYWFPEIGRRYAEALRGEATAGGYDAATTLAALTEALTRDVQAVAPDRHLLFGR